jgi:hypothetical protein
MKRKPQERVGACELLHSWIYPLQWVQAYVPTVPDGPWVDLLRAPFPFILGLTTAQARRGAALLHSTPLHSTPLHSTPLHSTPLQYTLLYSSILYSFILYSSILCENSLFFACSPAPRGDDTVIDDTVIQ